MFKSFTKKIKSICFPEPERHIDDTPHSERVYSENCRWCKGTSDVPADGCFMECSCWKDNVKVA